jgi:F1F0 ATPase subunit 2
MKDLSSMILALLAGVLLGMIFFGGLWWTIQRGVSSKSAAILFSSSLLLRMAITVAGFYFIARGNWRNLLACLCGFLLARLLLTRYIRTPVDARNPMVEEGRR